MTAWVLLVLLVALVLGAFLLFERRRVFEFERALEYRRGRFVRVLGPGQRWVFRPTTTITKLDVRPRFVSVPGQEVLSSDGVGLRVSLARGVRSHRSREGDQRRRELPGSPLPDAPARSAADHW